jgi:hypothetical protein
MKCKKLRFDDIENIVPPKSSYFWSLKVIYFLESMLTANWIDNTDQQPMDIYMQQQPVIAMQMIDINQTISQFNQVSAFWETRSMMHARNGVLDVKKVVFCPFPQLVTTSVPNGLNFHPGYPSSASSCIMYCHACHKPVATRVETSFCSSEMKRLCFILIILFWMCMFAVIGFCFPSMYK